MRMLSILALVIGGLWQMDAHAGLVLGHGSRPLSGARVIHQGESVLTDQNGTFQPPTHWPNQLNLTIVAAGHLETQFLSTDAQGTFRLSPEDRGHPIELRGELTDFGRLRQDGRVDTGIMMPALKVESLIHFDVMDLISPEADILSVLGNDISLPSNVTLPEQRETYIFPITLKKPQYRMFVKRADDYRLLSVHGQFPLKRVVDDMRAGKSIFDVLNQIRFIQTGVMDLNIKEDVQKLDLPVNQRPFNQTVEVQAPSLSRDDVLVAIALSEEQGWMMPSDLKRLLSGEKLSLMVPADTQQPRILSALLRRTPNSNILKHRPPLRWFDLISIDRDLLYDLFVGPTNNMIDADLKMITVALQLNPSAPATFLSRVTAPTRQGQTLTFTPPTPLDGVIAKGTYVSWSKVELVQQGKVTLERKVRLWEAYAPTWISSLEIPNHIGQESRGQNFFFRWEVSFMGLDQTLVGTHELTHVTRNSLDE